MLKLLRNCLIVVVAWFLLAVVYSIGKHARTADDQTGKESAAAEKQLRLTNTFETAAKLFNAKGPVKIDDVTTLTKTQAGPGGNLTFYYTVSGTGKSAPDALEKKIKPPVVANACGNPDMKRPMEDGGVYHMVYLWEDGTELGRTSIRISDCPA